jgi:phosphate transport system permease protein
LASNFPEADAIERGALMYAAVVLLLVTLVVNMLGTLIMAFAGK